MALFGAGKCSAVNTARRKTAGTWLTCAPTGKGSRRMRTWQSITASRLSNNGVGGTSQEHKEKD